MKSKQDNTLIKQNVLLIYMLNENLSQSNETNNR